MFPNKFSVTVTDTPQANSTSWSVLTPGNNLPTIFLNPREFDGIDSLKVSAGGIQ